MKHCVERSVAGKTVWLALENQASYREWVGVFTALPENYFKK